MNLILDVEFASLRLQSQNNCLLHSYTLEILDTDKYINLWVGDWQLDGQQIKILTRISGKEAVASQ